MEHKLLEITDKLFKEGIEKAEEERKSILQKAESEAAQIIANAQTKSAEIIKTAHKEADEMRARVNASIKLGIDNMLEKLKQDIRHMLVVEVVENPIKNQLQNSELLQQIIVAVSQNIFKAEENQIELRLKPADAEKIADYLKSQLQWVLQKEPVIISDEKITAGFKIGTSGSNYFIAFTDNDFNALLTQYFNQEVAGIFNA
ncbi:MAG: hypothetical protein ACK4IY_03160 [Chitinophagales bacterium]